MATFAWGVGALDNRDHAKQEGAQLRTSLVPLVNTEALDTNCIADCILYNLSQIQYSWVVLLWQGK